MRAAVVLFSVVALGGAGLLLRSRGAERPVPAAPARPQADPEDALRAMRDDLRTLRAELTELRQQAAAPARVETPAAPAPRGQGPDEVPRRSEDEVLDNLAGHARGEVKDPAWSRTTEAAIANALRGEGMKGSTLRQADCRSTLCRVEVAHEGTPAQDQFLMHAPRTPPFNQPGIAHRLNDPNSGESRTVVFIAREGHALPRLNP